MTQTVSEATQQIWSKLCGLTIPERMAVRMIKDLDSDSLRDNRFVLSVYHGPTCYFARLADEETMATICSAKGPDLASALTLLSDDVDIMVQDAVEFVREM